MNHYQLARADGHPDWSPGQRTFGEVWDHARDLLRFHKGAGFTIKQHPGKPGPMRKLNDIDERLQRQLFEANIDTVFTVASLLDNYSLSFRIHEVSPEKGQLVIAHAKAKIGTPYLFGVTDCSWLTMYCYGQEGVDLPHNAHLQHLENQVLSIDRKQVLPGDLLFHHDDDHVSIYLDNEGGFGRVLDTEPSDTGSPAGWPTPRLGTGVRVRPMTPGYYCDWANVCGIGRVVEINGRP
jgi:hypothetical protein